MEYHEVYVSQISSASIFQKLEEHLGTMKREQSHLFSSWILQISSLRLKVSMTMI